MLTLPEFIARWQAVTLSERSAAQQHFLDLCALLGQPSPAQADPTGSWYTFERGVSKTGGGQGFADVWMRGHFAWEYKGKHKNLEAAYSQLLQYREDLENPPLLVVCDLNRFEVHTNFTGTVKRVYAFTLNDLASHEPTPTCPTAPLDVLRALFTDPERLRPQQTSYQVTEKAAAEFSRLAESLRKRGTDPEQAAHFLMRLLFCLFAEDINLLPSRLFTHLIERTRTRPEDFNTRLRQLFASMSTGGSFGVEDIPYFNGGLFSDDHALELAAGDLDVLARAATLDWASVEPAIFGTLFERSLDPSKRSQLGAHYTGKDDILLIVEPVLMAPLRRRWSEVQQQAAPFIAKRDAATDRAARARHHDALARLLMGFTDEIAAVRVLDPACGSGNFLYVALKRMLDLEKEVSIFAVTNGLPGLLPKVDPSQLYGIEINSYAYELASVVVWIGYIQWLHDNGFGVPSTPILKPLHNIQQMDAILAYDDQGRPTEPEWPEADVIIGNPPFLGGQKVRQGLGDTYVNNLFKLYGNRIPASADLVCYWFERARYLIASGHTKRAGLLATQGIRGGTNRKVLESIKANGDIFWAQSDRNWVLDGANVHVSMIAFDNGTEKNRLLDGVSIPSINANLTGTLNLIQAQRLVENVHISFMGDIKVGAFDIEPSLAQRMLTAQGNPNGRPNSEVIRPWVNGIDITSRSRNMWIIDFGVDMAEEKAALYQMPFEYVKQHVKSTRLQNKMKRRALFWWIHGDAAPRVRNALGPLQRYIASPRVTKHRLFVWLDSSILPDGQLIVFARDDDYFFGILHSKLHELWARGQGTQLREVESGFRYTPTTTFETYPFPWPPGHEPKDDPRVEAVAQAARELVEKRDAWLNPPDTPEAELKKRTLTNLYNARPTWLDLAHSKLDRAVLDAYGWPHGLPDDQILERLLALNLQRATAHNP